MAETFKNGYHVFALSCEAREPVDSHSFDRLQHRFIGNYRSQELIGPAAGTREWELPLPSLKGYSAATATFRGREYTYSDYIRALFSWQQRTGTPFVLRSPHNNQYYLIEIAETKESFKKKLSSIWETSLNLKQVRNNDTVFDVNQVENVWSWFKGDEYVDNEGVIIWSDQTGGGQNLISEGDVLPVADVQNDLGVMRLNSDAGEGLFSYPGTVPIIYEAFIVMKMREDEFSNSAGVWTADESVPILLGDIGESEFFNIGIGSMYEYRFNGIPKTEAAQTAPMNAFALLHLRFATGLTIEHFQFGKDRAASDGFALADFGEIILFDGLLKEEDAAEMTEHLMLRWNIS